MSSEETVSDEQYYENILDSLPKNLSSSLRDFISIQPIYSKYLSSSYNILIIAEAPVSKEIVESILSSTEDTAFIQNQSNKAKTEIPEHPSRIVQYITLDGEAKDSTYEPVYEIDEPLVGILPNNIPLLTITTPKHGKFEEYEPINSQIPIKSDIISEYDVIYPYQFFGSLTSNQNKGSNQLNNKKDIEINLSDYSDIATDKYMQLDLINSYYTAKNLEKILAVDELSFNLDSRELLYDNLKNLGLDPHAGEFDADMIESGTPQSQRDKIHVLLDIVEDICKRKEEDENADRAIATMDEIIDEATEEKDMDKEEIKERIEELEEAGKEIYSPGAAEGYRRI